MPAIDLETYDLRLWEREVLVAAMKAHGGKFLHAARALGISRSSLYAKARRHGLVGPKLGDGFNPFAPRLAAPGRDLPAVIVPTSMT